MPKGDPKKKVFYGNSLASYKKQNEEQFLKLMPLKKLKACV